MDETQTPTEEKQTFRSCVHIEQKENFLCYIYFGDDHIEHKQTLSPSRGEKSCWEDEYETAKGAKSAFNLLYLWLIGIQIIGAKQPLPFTDEQTKLFEK